MKTKLFFLTSTISFSQNAAVKNNHGRDRLMNFVEEFGAWMLLVGFIIVVFWLVGIFS